FELGKCYEEAVKGGELLALASIHPVLCDRVAGGRALPAPERTVPIQEGTPSPSRSQGGRNSPTDGRRIGIITAVPCDRRTQPNLRQQVADASMTPLVIAPRGGSLGEGSPGGHSSGASGISFPVQRSFLTARSVEFDAVLVAAIASPEAATPPAADAKTAAG